VVPNQKYTHSRGSGRRVGRVHQLVGGFGGVGGGGGGGGGVLGLGGLVGCGGGF